MRAGHSSVCNGLEGYLCVCVWDEWQMSEIYELHGCFGARGNNWVIILWELCAFYRNIWCNPSVFVKPVCKAVGILHLNNPPKDKYVLCM